VNFFCPWPFSPPEKLPPHLYSPFCIASSRLLLQPLRLFFLSIFLDDLLPSIQHRLRVPLHAVENPRFRNEVVALSLTIQSKFLFFPLRRAPPPSALLPMLSLSSPCNGLLFPSFTLEPIVFSQIPPYASLSPRLNQRNKRPPSLNEPPQVRAPLVPNGSPRLP